MEDDKEITSCTVDDYKFSVNSGNKHTGYVLSIEDVSPLSDFDRFNIYAIQPNELRKIAEVFAKAADQIEEYWIKCKLEKESKSG